MPDLNAPYERLLPWVRAQFPQVDRLRNGEYRVYLDNAAGTLVPRAVADAIAEAALWMNPQPSRFWPAGPITLHAQREVRKLLRDFLNAPEGDPLYLSESTTACLYKLRDALEPAWQSGDNLVVTDTDHFANISPWEWRARWEVRQVRMLPDGHLDLEHLASRVDDETQVVALTLASNGLGTIPRLQDAIRLVRERASQAVVVVDAVHAAPHLPIDVQALGADALAFSTYKLFGPNCGVLWLSETLTGRLDPYHVEPHTDRETLLEWGTLSNVTVAGIQGALDYVLRLGERLEPHCIGQWADYPRRRRLFKVALAGIRDYEHGLSARVLEALRDVEAVQVLGIPERERATERVPTFAFTVHGVDDGDLERRLWEFGRVQVAVGSHYSAAVTRGLGRAAVARASFAHYNDATDVDAFLHALRSLV